MLQRLISATACAPRRLSLFAGILALGVLLACSPDTGEGGASAAPAAQLSGLHRQLNELQSGRRSRVNIVQIGDSHTATDHLSGRLRELFQRQFGDAGRGLMPPGYPFPYWRPYQVRVQQSGSWQVVSSNHNGAEGTFGLSGFVTRGSKSTDSMTLVAEDANARDGGSFDMAEIHYFKRPGGGAIQVYIDGRFHSEINTSAGAYLLDRATINAPHARSLELRPRGNGRVDIADWAVYRRQRGVTLASLGFSGAQIGILGRWDWKITAYELKHLDPALVILAFGTNEGFAARESLGDYGQEFGSYVDRIRNAVPRASIVIVGPPDADRFPSYCGRGRGANASCAPLRGSEIENYSAMLRARDRSLCRWHAPAAIAYVREAQRQAARRRNIYFFDWAKVQGGDCGADRFARNGLGHSDHVHMREAGYHLTADRLFNELMAGYRRR
ncbi:MAG: GDSL-type esterase/lipase family protein [Reyranellaceae bacterium]